MSAPKPLAEGTLAQTPLAHVLLSILRKRLDGTLAVWPEDGTAGQDRILFENGRPVAGRLLERASALDRGLLQVFRREKAPYAFYEADLVGDGERVLTGTIEPYALIAARLRGGARKDALQKVLGSLGMARLRIRPGVDLSLYELTRKEMAFIEVIRAEPASAADLVTRAGDPRKARRLLYLLALTGSLDSFAIESQPPAPMPTGPPSGGPPGPPSGAPSGPPSGSPSGPPSGSHSGPPSGSHRGPSSGAYVSPSGAHRGPSSGAYVSPSGAHLPRGATPTGGSKRPGALEPEAPPKPPGTLSGDLLDRWNMISDYAMAIESLNYFEMLEVSQAADERETRDAYFGKVKVWHPDRLPPELVDLKPWAERVFHYLTEARDVLGDAESRKGYIKNVQQGGGTPAADRKVDAIVGAAFEFQKVEILVRRKAWVEAMEILETAIELSPDDPDYHAMTAWVTFQQHGTTNKKVVERIMASADRALELRPEHERAHFTKGAVYKQTGRDELAMTHFAKVVDINPKHTDAARELRLARMRGGKKSKPPPKAGDSMFSKFFGSKKK